MAEELDFSVVEKNFSGKEETSARVDSLDATWDDTEPKSTLSDISFKIPKGDLLAVVGRVGSGKSSLLSALLGIQNENVSQVSSGEMGKLKGKIGVNGKLAYVPQQSWIQNATVKDNILFGKPYNRQLYKKVP